MKKIKSYFGSQYPDVGAERDRVYISLEKLRIAKEKEVRTVADRNKMEEKIDSTVSSLVKENDPEEPDQ